MMEDNKMMGGKCGCKCHRGKGVVGVLVALVGLAFLLRAFGVLTDRFVEILWPAVVLVAGIKMAAKAMCKCCDHSQDRM